MSINPTSPEIVAPVRRSAAPQVRVPAWRMPSARALKALKLLVFALALTPFARLVWLAFHDGLGANPVEFVTRSTGWWTLFFLCVTLAVTPLRRMLALHWLLRLRRMLGLFAFFYVVLHFTTYLWWDQDFAVASIAKDIVKRPFITVGFAAFVLLVPLAATSFNAAVRWLGGARWQALHRLVYGVVCLGALHFWWMKAGKNLLLEPGIFAAVVALLLGYRLVARARSRRSGNVAHRG
ncbi:MAG: sulfoxide reductase heme-binding subunit YedZ [Betaproteobacteria bacterium]|nr:sulfoxide reductase heme-binding subunit YedZ [Betaproteobacteria bacterium]